MKTKVIKFFFGTLFLSFLTSTYTPAQIPLEFVQKQFERKQARYDAGYDLALQVNEKIKNLQIQYNEVELTKALSSLQKELHSIQDFGAEYNRVKRIDSDVDFELSKYINRVQTSKSQTSSNQTSLTNNYQSTVPKQKTKEELVQEYWVAAKNDFDLNNYESAAQNCSKLIELIPDNPELYWTRSSLYSDLGKYPLAITDITTFIRLTDKDSVYKLAVAYYNRARCKSFLVDHYGALDDLSKADELLPKSSQILNQIAWEKLLMKNYSEALKDANKAVSYDNTDYNAIDTRAEIKLNLKDYKGCLADCEMVLKLNPYPNTYLIKGRALFEVGDKENACKSWSKAGELGKTEAYDYISKYCN